MRVCDASAVASRARGEVCSQRGLAAGFGQLAEARSIGVRGGGRPEQHGGAAGDVPVGVAAGGGVPVAPYRTDSLLQIADHCAPRGGASNGSGAGDQIQIATEVDDQEPILRLAKVSQHERLWRDDRAVDPAGTGDDRVGAPKAEQIAVERVRLGMRLALGEIQLALLERRFIDRRRERIGDLRIRQAGELREELPASPTNRLPQLRRDDPRKTGTAQTRRTPGPGRASASPDRAASAR